MTPTAPLVSCLCVTERRPAFAPWLLWNARKQDHHRRELIVVDGSPAASWPEDVVHVACPAGTSVARKRNLALEAARGDVVAWFDDDDWQHPRRLSLLVAALAAGAAVAGARRGWMVSLDRLRARAHDAPRGVLFNGLGARRETVERVRFDERRARAADTPWLAAVRREAEPVVVPELLSFWLCHRDNLSNPARRYVFPHPLDAVRASAGLQAWEGTDAELAALRGRVAQRGHGLFRF